MEYKIYLYKYIKYIRCDRSDQDPLQTESVQQHAEENVQNWIKKGVK